MDYDQRFTLPTGKVANVKAANFYALALYIVRYILIPFLRWSGGLVSSPASSVRHTTSIATVGTAASVVGTWTSPTYSELSVV
jgi:hypothetical protein